MNKDTSYSLEYHEKTKHSETSVMSHHYLDWNNKPFPFKIYPNLQSVQLPSDFCVPSMNALNAISTINPSEYNNHNNKKYQINFALSEKENKTLIKNKNRIETKTITLEELAKILFFSAGITRTINYGNNLFYMRAASATGALYPIEMYIVCKNILPKLESGIYHFNPALFSLVPIRNGDHRSLLSSTITEDNNDISSSPLTIIFTSIAWRNAWKYQDRSYRHWFWDGGVIAANMLSIASSINATTKIHMGFIDDKVNEILALEKEKEAAIAMISIDIDSIHNSYTKTKDIEKEKEKEKEKRVDNSNQLKYVPLSRSERKFPLIWKTHESSKLFTNTEVREWINAGFQINNTIGSSHLNKYSPISEYKRIKLLEKHQTSTVPNIGETILKRGSSRKFARTPISFTTLSSILFNSTRGISMDFKKDEETLIDIYLIVNDVKRIHPGGYFYNRFHNSIDLIKEKVSRNISGYLCLDQSLFSDASAVLFLMSNLDKVIEKLGNRGYRAAQFEAGIIAGKIYLSAYANAIGASGSTFYDDAVTEFFLPHSINKNTMIAIGIGNPNYKSRSGKILPIIFSKEQLLEKANKSLYC